MSGAAFGILGAGLGLLAGFIVIDAIAGTVRCANGECGAEMHASKQQEHIKTHHPELVVKQHKHDRDAGDIDSDLGFGGNGVDFPDVNWEGL